MSALIEAANEAFSGKGFFDLDTERTGKQAEILGDLVEFHGANRREAEELLASVGSKSCGRLLIRLWDAGMGNYDWWRLLRDNWSGCDDLANVVEGMREIIGEAEPRELLWAMTPYERKTWRALPDTLTVYRGCYDHNRDGLSWSLSRKVAERFTTLQRYHHTDESSLLLTGTVSKHSVFLKTDRHEREVVAPHVAVIAQFPAA